MKTQYLVKKVEGELYNEGVADGVTYTITYNGKTFAANSGKALQDFEEFSNYLLADFIMPIKRIRKIPASDTSRVAPL